MSSKDKQSATTRFNVRPEFQDGQKLTSDKLNAIRKNIDRRQRLHALGMAGVGVVYGFQVHKKSEGLLHIDCGLAFDKHGRQLSWPGGDVPLNNIVGKFDGDSSTYALHVHYAERPADLDEAPDCLCPPDDVDIYEEGVVFSITHADPVNPDRRCEFDNAGLGHLDTGSGDTRQFVCDELAYDGPEKLGLCDELPELCPAPCRWSYDPSSGLALNIVTVSKNTIKAVAGACEQRSPVFRNPLLRSLIEKAYHDLTIGDRHQSERLKQALLGSMGSGLVFGFKVTCTDTVCSATKGLIIDRWGRQLFWPGGELPVAMPKAKNGVYYLKVSYAEKISDQGTSRRSPFVHGALIEEGVTFSLSKKAEKPSQNTPTDLSCLTQNEYIEDRLAVNNTHSDVDIDPFAEFSEFGNSHTDPCPTSAKWQVPPEDENNRSWFDLVQLELSTSDEKGREIAIKPVAALIYRNPLLKELIDQTDARLDRAIEIQSERMRAALLGVAGSGMVYGFELTLTDDKTLSVAPGLGIDPLGRQLHWTGTSVALDEIVLPPNTPKGEYALHAHYAVECSFDEGYLRNGNSSGAFKPYLLKETIVFSLRAISDAPQNPETKDECLSQEQYVCARLGSQSISLVPVDSELSPLNSPLAEARWNNDTLTYATMNKGLNLGRVTLASQGSIGSVESCGNEPRIYRNPLLFDLFKRDEKRLNDSHEWQAERMRHALLGIAGSGVVYGFGLDAPQSTAGKVYVKPGLAIDTYGRQLQWPGGAVTLVNTPSASGRHTLKVHFAEQCDFDGIKMNTSDGDTRWMSELLRFSLVPESATPITGTPPLASEVCTTEADYLCDRLGFTDNGIIELDAELSHAEQSPATANLASPADSPLGIHEGAYYDPIGMVLAEVDVNVGADASWRLVNDSALICDRREHVYRNPQLFELHTQTNARLDRVQQTQASNLRRALLGVAGTGVVSGFDIDWSSDSSKCKISDGLAIDKHGRPLYWDGESITLDSVMDPPKETGRYTLKVHYSVECSFSEGYLRNCAEKKPYLLKEGVSFTLEKVVAEQPTEPTGQNGDLCYVQEAYICSRSGVELSALNVDPVDPDLQALGTVLPPSCFEDDDSIVFDMTAGVTLGIVEIKQADDDSLYFGRSPVAEICGVRQNVYRNRVLFELIEHANARLDRIFELQSEQMRHAMLGIAGSGVVYGYDIKHKNKRALSVSPGLVIDQYGRQLYWTGEELNLDASDSTNALALPDNAEAGTYRLKAYYAVECTYREGYKRNCEQGEPYLLKETLVFALEPGRAQSADSVDTEGLCLSQESYICNRLGSTVGVIAVDGELTVLDTPLQRPCDDSNFITFTTADAGFTLGEVELRQAEGGELEFNTTAPVVCETRQHVYRNPLLFDLFKRDEKRLNDSHEWQAERMRHALLGIAGSGVVYGFGLDAPQSTAGKVYVKPGLAIDTYGRQLQWPGGAVTLVNTPSASGRHTLKVHFAEQCDFDGIKMNASDGDTRWMSELLRFSLVPETATPITGTPPLASEVCTTEADYLCDRLGFTDNGIIELDAELAHAEQSPATANLASPADSPLRIHEGAYYDPIGMVLAEVDVNVGADASWRLVNDSALICDRREHVYRNPQLFELHTQTNARLDRVQQTQASNLRRALLGVAGTGVVSGFDIDWSSDSSKCKISDGLAIDKHGRPLYWDGESITLDSVMDPPKETGRYTLKVHYSVECSFSEGYLRNCAEKKPYLLKEGVSFTLEKVVAEQPSEPTEPTGQNGDLCYVQEAYICSRSGVELSALNVDPVDPDLQALGTVLPPSCFEDDDSIVFDMTAGVTLGIVEIKQADDDSLYFGRSPVAEICGVRQNVYRNRVLFELIEHANARLDRIFELQSEQMRHAMLGIAGSGVVYGYDIKHKNKRALSVSPGLVIDQYGRQLYWTGEELNLDASDSTNALALPENAEAGTYRLKAYYAVECTYREGYKRNCEQGEPYLLKETLVFALEPGRAQSADSVDTEGLCLSQESYICNRLGSTVGVIAVDGELTVLDTPLQRPCDDSNFITFTTADAGFTLGEVELRQAEGGEFEFNTTAPVVCETRQHVYRNPLLFDLLQRTEDRLNTAYKTQSQRMNQALLGLAGSGVLYGFDIDVAKSTTNQLFIKPGLAFDAYGRQLFWNGGPVVIASTPTVAGDYTVNVHFAERCVFDGVVRDAHSDQTRWMTEELLFTLSDGSTDLTPMQPSLTGECVREEDYICDRLNMTQAGNVAADAGLHKLGESTSDKPLTSFTQADKAWRYDSHAGLPLASVALVVDGDGWSLDANTQGANPEICSSRSIVARNPILFELHKQTQQRMDTALALHEQRMRHAMLGIAGVGVVYGFRLDPDHAESSASQLFVHCGLAIDSYGRQLYWPGGSVSIDQLAKINAPTHEGDYTLHVHFAEYCSNDGHRLDPLDPHTRWLTDALVFSLTPGANKIEHASPVVNFDQECPKPEDYICDRLGSTQTGKVSPDPELAKLCKAAPSSADFASLSHDGKDWRYDQTAGLALGAMSITGDASGWTFTANAPSVCEYREHVKRNTLLFELLNGYQNDFARVTDIIVPKGIDDHTDIDLSTYWQASRANPTKWHIFRRIMRNGIRIAFNKPIQASSLSIDAENPHHEPKDRDQKPYACMNCTVSIRRRHVKDNEFTELKRLTISFIEPVGDIITVNGIPCVTGVNVSFELGDFNDNDDFDSDDGAERLDDSGGLVEFTIRGAFLRDACGRMLDARPPDLDPNLPGQARPGGDLLFPFFVLGTRRHGHNRDWENNYD